MNEKDRTLETQEQEQAEQERARLETRPLPAHQLFVKEDGEIEIVLAGYLDLHITPTSVQTPPALTSGTILQSDEAVLVPGGPVAHIVQALLTLGVQVRPLAKVGNDLFGQGLLRRVGNWGPGMTTLIGVVPDEPTSYTIQLHLPKLERVAIVAPGSNATFGADDMRYSVLERAGLFHLSYTSEMTRLTRAEGAELVTLFTRAKETGVTTSFDFAVPGVASTTAEVNWQAIFPTFLPSVDVFLASVDELLRTLRRPLFDKLLSRAGNTPLVDLVPPDVISDLSKTLIEMGVKIVGLKAGHRGMYLRTAPREALEHIGRMQPPKITTWADRELWAPCFTTTVVDATGAGDATIAGFLLGLIRGLSPEAALSAACAVGACSVEAKDPVSGIKGWPETMGRIAAGWPRLKLQSKPRSPLDMQHYGWRWHETQELWIKPHN